MQSVDEQWMGQALELAREAGLRGEVPVGALIVKDGILLSTGLNSRESQANPLGHAELAAISQAAAKLQAWRLIDCTLYVTLEPCVMCAGALVQSRIKRVVIGTLDPKGGALSSLYQIGQDPRLNHQIEMTSGVLEKECSEILKDFFKQKRMEKKT
jgi:tRNA(adenine34) deaminase